LKGGSALMAVEVLKKQGVPEDKICESITTSACTLVSTNKSQVFLNLIASPEGIENFAKQFPDLRIITAFIDEGLDEHNYIVPGLG